MSCTKKLKNDLESEHQVDASNLATSKQFIHDKEFFFEKLFGSFRNNLQQAKPSSHLPKGGKLDFW